MKFSQVQGLVFWWPVKVHVPDPDNAGQTIEQGFEAQFLQISEETRKAIGDSEHVDRAFMSTVLQNVRKLEDDDGKPVPFTGELVDQLADNPFTRQGLYLAYAEGLSGVKRKN